MKEYPQLIEDKIKKYLPLKPIESISELNRVLLEGNLILINQNDTQINPNRWITNGKTNKTALDEKDFLSIFLTSELEGRFIFKDDFSPNKNIFFLVKKYEMCYFMEPPSRYRLTFFKAFENPIRTGVVISSWNKLLYFLASLIFER